MVAKLFATFVLLSLFLGCKARLFRRRGPIRSCADPRAPRCPDSCVMENGVPVCKPKAEKCGRNEHSANGKCYCDIGTQRNNGGACVAIGPIAIGGACPPGYQLRKDGRCIDVNDEICRPELNEFPTGTTDGCDCKKGFERNQKNVCVPESGGDPAQGVNPCSKARCPGECVSENGRPVCKSVPTPKEKCQANEYSTGAGCDCIKGFVRNEKNVCVPTDKAGRSSDVNPCSNVRCPGECVVENGRPMCKPVPTPEGPKHNCTRCGPRVTTKAPPAANDPCDIMRCEEGTTCHVQNGQGVCLKPSAISNPCAKTDCPSGHECIVERVQCVRAPCPPIATCKKLEKRR